MKTHVLGAVNKTTHVLQNQATVTDDAFGVVQRVSNAARSTLEGAILLDPLIVALLPTILMKLYDDTGASWHASRSQASSASVSSSNAAF
jgi:hypothetical protein